MLKIIYLLLAFGAIFALVNGQDCVPLTVTNVTLTSTATLSWAIREEEPCEITHFQVHISGSDPGSRYIVRPDTTTVDVDFLPACELWYFNILAYSGEIHGSFHLFISKIPAPLDANLSIGPINVTRPEEERDVHLQWDLNNPFVGDCALRYRVTISGDDGDVISDIYSDEKFLNLHFLSPCVQYEFGVRAINTADPIIEGPLSSIIYNYPAIVQEAPALESVSLGATNVNLVFSLETLAKNSCPVREFYVEGGQYFNITLSVEDGDEREPVDVQITNLLPDRMYTLKASVQNSAGWSQATFIAVQTLDLQPDADAE